jgi:hypothetical protein
MLEWHYSEDPVDLMQEVTGIVQAKEQKGMRASGEAER